jgi:hypothetical protein
MPTCLALAGRSCYYFPGSRCAFRHRTAVLLLSSSAASVRGGDAAFTKLCILQTSRCCGELQQLHVCHHLCLVQHSSGKVSVITHFARPRGSLTSEATDTLPALLRRGRSLTRRHPVTINVFRVRNNSHLCPTVGALAIGHPQMCKRLRQTCAVGSSG